MPVVCKSYLPRLRLSYESLKCRWTRTCRRRIFEVRNADGSGRRHSYLLKIPCRIHLFWIVSNADLLNFSNIRRFDFEFIDLTDPNEGSLIEKRISYRIFFEWIWFTLQYKFFSFTIQAVHLYEYFCIGTGTRFVTSKNSDLIWYNYKQECYQIDFVSICHSLLTTLFFRHIRRY